jgi:nucleoside-diphosphate-sugar epimerase
LSRRPCALPGMTSLVHDIADTLPRLPHLKEAIVVHCAGEIRSSDWLRHWNSNCLGTRNLLAWARDHEARRFILFSTGGVYGYCSGQRMRETAPAAPAGPYARSKYLAEISVRSHADLFGLEIVIFRLYFPFDRDYSSGIFRRVAECVANGAPLRINRGGAPRMTPVHLADVAEAVARSTAADFPAGCYNLCGNQDVSFLDLVRGTEARLGKTANLVWSDEPCGDLMGDNTALRHTGWRPKVGIDDLVPAIS